MPAYRRKVRIYLMLLGAALVFAAGYAVRRDFYGRYCVLRQTRESVEGADEQVEALEQRVSHSQRREKDLDETSVELEATIRQIKGRVRKDEKVFRMELLPPHADLETPAAGDAEARPDGPVPVGATIGLRGESEPRDTTE